MNAIDLLEQQHEEALTLCRQLCESDAGEARSATFKQLSSALLAHMVVEEELFYPTAARAKANGEPIVEAYEEHATARTALIRCEMALEEEGLFQVRMRVLEELLEHHIAQERSELFPQARKDLGDDQLEGLGLELEAVFSKAVKASNPAHRLDRLSTERELEALSP